jgi:hypothetical protein
LSTWEITRFDCTYINVLKYILLQLPVGYDISPLKRVKKYRNSHGHMKENLIFPLFNMSFISKYFGRPLPLHKTCGERHETF